MKPIEWNYQTLFTRVGYVDKMGWIDAENATTYIENEVEVFPDVAEITISRIEGGVRVVLMHWRRS